MTVSAVYLYGIVAAKENLNFGQIGLGKGKVSILQYDDLGAVVSELPPNYIATAEDALIHEAVIRKVMEDHTIIPMGFGVIAEDYAKVNNILKRGRMTLKQALEKIKNKIQVNVTVSWDKKAVLERILKEKKDVKALSKKVSQRSEKKLRIELGKRVQRYLDEKRKEIVPVITGSLRSLSESFDENKVKDKDTLMNISFLLDKTLEQEFYDKTDELESKYIKQIKLLAVGPLPPYNFSLIEVRKPDFDAIDDARKTLGLGEESNIAEINSAYKRLVHNYHPDLNPEKPSAAIKLGKIKKAYNVLTEYCRHHLCSFNRLDIEETIIIREKT